MTDNDIIQGFKHFDPAITQQYFYGYCQEAYRIFDSQYHLSEKDGLGLDYYSLTHDYYITLVQEGFASLDHRPQDTTLRKWMIGAFKFVVLNALRAYNQHYGNLSMLAPEQILAQYFINPAEDIVEQIVNLVEHTYRDPLMTTIAQMLLHRGCQQTDCAQILGITPSAVNQRLHRMMDEVVTPFVIKNYPNGIPAKDPTNDHNDIRHRQADIPVYRNEATPLIIDHLKPEQVLVYGSDMQGVPVGPAGRQALPFLPGHPILGFNGCAYAIAIFSSKACFRADVAKFCKFAEIHEEKIFLVTELDYCLAGYSVELVANLFDSARNLDNVCFPASFQKILYPD